MNAVDETEPDTPFLEVRNSRMRRSIAEWLTASKQTVPHFYLTANCEVDALMQARKAFNLAHGDSPLSLNDLVIKAVALAFQRVPDANVSWADKVTRQFSRVDIAIAVATDGGLITPILRGVDAMQVTEIAAKAREMAERARKGELAPHEYRGGTATISNLGMFGVEQFAAIVNPPHASIFAIGAAVARPVIRNGAVAAATIMTCTLSVDHRGVDGAVAARLLDAFKSAVEDPGVLFPEP